MMGLRQAWLTALTAAVLGFPSTGLSAADAPVVRALHVQQNGTVTYFHVRLSPPKGLRLPPLTATAGLTEGGLRDLARLPRLVPQDRATRAVYLRLNIPGDEQGELRVAGTGDLEFVGRCSDPVRAARLLLLYPTGEVAAAGGDGQAPLVRRRGWGELALRLDFDDAERVAPPAGKRGPERPPAGDDLEGLWAAAQAARFAVLEARTGTFGFYGFAREVTGRKYGVRAPALARPPEDTADTSSLRLYETITGAAAVAETLQLQRLRPPRRPVTSVPGAGDQAEARTVPIARVPGIAVADHPWEKMMAGRKPAAEPLAGWVPGDNYYLHFKTFANFLDFSELADRWVNTVLRAAGPDSRDYEIRSRYGRQICLRDTPFVRQFGPTFVKSLAVTGSDLNLLDGSDITTIFLVTNRQLFLASVESFIQEARDQFGDRLQEKKTDYHGVTVESYVTRLREVSLYRAAVEDVVIYSNSLAGLRRVVDTHQGRHAAVAAAPEFLYMRTVFRLQDEGDGFFLLPDAFLRGVSGPEARIKEKRRIEARASLHLVTDAALFAAWEDGSMPVEQRALLAASALRPDEIDGPDGEGARWDGQRRLAISDVYNTLHFATPLVELPIDKITPTEERDYLRFRNEYINQWHPYVGPVGLRLTLNDKQLRVEMLLLPQAPTGDYRNLRRYTGDGTVTLDPAAVPADSLVQFLMHMSPDLQTFIAHKGALGNAFLFRMADSELYGKLAELGVRKELEPEAADFLEQQAERVLFRLPAVAGVRMGEPRAFDEMFASFADLLNLFAGPLTQEALKPPYKGATINRAEFTPGSFVARSLNDPDTPRERRFVPVLYHAKAGGAWYISPSEAALKDAIDRAAVPDEKAQGVPVSDSLLVAPKAAVKARDALGFYLEWQSHKRAQANEPRWYVLFHDGLLPEELTERTMRDVALHYLGFMPVSPEGALYAYDARTDEVVNARHGSLRQPVLRAGLDAGSPLAQLLEEFRTFRADLRFRADGIHTVVTVERRLPPGKR